MATTKSTTTKTIKKPTAGKKPASKAMATKTTAGATKLAAGKAAKAAAPITKPVPRSVARKAKTAKTKVKTTTIRSVQAVKARNPRVGFIEFLREQSVVGLAIGLIIGAQTKALSDQLIASFINPLIGLVLPGKGALDQKVFVMQLEEKTATFAWGSFLAVLLSFLTTAAVVYFVFKFLKLDRLTKRKQEASV